MANHQAGVPWIAHDGAKGLQREMNPAPTRNGVIAQTSMMTTNRIPKIPSDQFFEHFHVCTSVKAEPRQQNQRGGIGLRDAFATRRWRWGENLGQREQNTKNLICVAVAIHQERNGRIDGW